MADRKSIMLYLNDLEQWEMLSPEQAGELIVALLRYAKTGDRIETEDGMLRMAFSFMTAQIDRDGEKYEQRCARNKEIAEQREKSRRERTLTNVHERAEEETESTGENERARTSTNVHERARTYTNVTDADAEADAEADADTPYGGKRARAREAPSSASRTKNLPGFDRIWEAYPAEYRLARDYLPSACEQECIDNADDVLRAIPAYVEARRAKGKDPARGRDFFDGMWRGFVPPDEPPASGRKRRRQG